MTARSLADTVTTSTPGVTAAIGAAEPPDGLAAPVVAPATVPAAPGTDTAFSRAAREAAEILGDACLVWRVDDGGRLEPTACHHRDGAARAEMAGFLDEGPLEPASGDDGGQWPVQVLARLAPLRVRKARPRELGVEAPLGMRRAHALLVPMTRGGQAVGVLAIVREPREPRYSLREEAILRRLAGRAVARLGGGTGERHGDGPPPTLPDDGGRPPGDGTGGAPPTWLIDHVGVGVWLTDRDGTTTYVNNAMTELLAVPARSVVGHPMRDFLDDPPQMVRGEYCLDEERCDRRITQPDGRHVWLEMTSQPLLDEAGSRAGTINTAVDITDRKQVELAARRRVPRPHRRS